MENVLLPPAARAASALVFGVALIVAGEFIRRRFGAAEDSATAYLPSVFAGAGLVSLFGAVLSAQMLYDLIGTDTAMIGMILVAAVAMVLGWFYGPLLAAIGVIGAFAAPMVLGGGDSDPTPLFGYYALITAVGLGVDTLRRWAWVSGLTGVLAYVMGALLFDGDQSLFEAFQLYCVAIALMAIVIPARSIMLDHKGMMFVEWAIKLRAGERPIFPVFLAWGAVITSSCVLWMMSSSGETEFWVPAIALAVLSALLVVWSLKARALQDLALIPLFGLVLSIEWQPVWSGVRKVYSAVDDIGSETAFPMTATALVGIGLILSALAAWRSLSKGSYPMICALIAAVYAPPDCHGIGDDMVPINRNRGLSLGATRGRLGRLYGVLGRAFCTGGWARTPFTHVVLCAVCTGVYQLCPCDDPFIGRFDGCLGRHSCGCGSARPSV